MLSELFLYYIQYKVPLDFIRDIPLILLTEIEVCMGKYLPEVFVQTERRRSEVCADKPKANTFPYKPSKTRLINCLLYGSLNTFSDFHIFV